MDIDPASPAFCQDVNQTTPTPTKRPVTAMLTAKAGKRRLIEQNTVAGGCGSFIGDNITIIVDGFFTLINPWEALECVSTKYDSPLVMAL